MKLRSILGLLIAQAAFFAASDIFAQQPGGGDDDECTLEMKIGAECNTPRMAYCEDGPGCINEEDGTSSYCEILAGEYTICGDVEIGEECPFCEDSIKIDGGYVEYYSEENCNWLYNTGMELWFDCACSTN